MDAFVKRNGKNITSAVNAFALVELIVNACYIAVFVKFNTENRIFNIIFLRFNGGVNAFTFNQLESLAAHGFKLIGQEHKLAVDICAGKR